MAWIEQVAERTRKAKIFQDDANPARRRAVFGIHDLHYHDGSAWQELDEALVDDGADGFAHRCDKTRHIIRMGATGTRRWYPRREYPDEYIEFGRLQAWSGSAWGNVNLGTPTRSANTITWDTTNFRLTLTNTWRRVKIEAVLKTEAARRRLRWAVALHGLTWDAWQLRGADDEVVGTLDKPSAWDATQTPGAIDFAPNVTITTSYSGGYVEFGGALAGATLPITIDPTFTDGYGGDVTTYCDSPLYLINPTTNFGTTTTGTIGMAIAYDYCARLLIKFDLASIATATLNSATFSLYMTAEDADVGRVLSVYRQKRAWVEAQATWNAYATGSNWSTAGGFHTDDCEQSGIGSKSFGATEAAGYKDFALSGTLVGDLDIGNGWLVKSAEVDDWDRWTFALSDHATTDYRPKLVVDYTAEAAGGNPYYAFAQQM